MSVVFDYVPVTNSERAALTRYINFMHGPAFKHKDARLEMDLQVYIERKVYEVDIYVLYTFNDASMDQDSVDTVTLFISFVPNPLLPYEKRRAMLFEGSAWDNALQFISFHVSDEQLSSVWTSFKNKVAPILLADSFFRLK